MSTLRLTRRGTLRRESNVRLRIRNPFYFTDVTNDTLVEIVCFHCGREYYVTYGNIRVANYCTGCK